MLSQRASIHSKILIAGLGAMAHAYNLSYQEGGDKRITV
jgi:hypothetical protein